MRIFVLIAALFVACDKQSKSEAKAKGPELDANTELPEVKVAPPVAEEDEGVDIELTRDGIIRFKNRSLSLDGLGDALSEATDAYDKKMRAKGRSGRLALPGGSRASRLAVLLHVHQEAPWQHVQWILTACAENKIFKTSFAATRDGKPSRIPAYLPTDKGIGPVAQEPINEIMVSVHIVSREEVPGVFGPKDARQKITKPTEVKYKFGLRESADPRAVHTWVRQAFEAAKGVERASVVGEIKAGHKVPFKFIVAVLNTFAEAGLPRVDFYGTQIPSRKLRARPNLPYPEHNYSRTD